MKKLLILVSVLLMCSIIYNILAGRAIQEEMDYSSAIASTNFPLANQLFFDGLSRKQIDIYADQRNKPALHEVQGYEIRIIPIIMQTPPSSPSWSNFISHNNTCVANYACHIWDENRKLAIALLSLLRNGDTSAKYIFDGIKEDGTLTPEAKHQIENAQHQYDWNIKQYGEQSYRFKKPSNKEIQPTSRGAAPPSG